MVMANFIASAQLFASEVKKKIIIIYNISKMEENYIFLNGEPYTSSCTHNEGFYEDNLFATIIILYLM